MDKLNKHMIKHTLVITMGMIIVGRESMWILTGVTLMCLGLSGFNTALIVELADALKVFGTHVVDREKEGK